MSEQNQSNSFANSFLSSLGKQLGNFLGIGLSLLLPIAMCASVLFLLPDVTNVGHETVAILGGVAITSALATFISAPYAIIIGFIFWAIMGNVDFF